MPNLNGKENKKNIYPFADNQYLSKYALSNINNQTTSDTAQPYNNQSKTAQNKPLNKYLNKNVLVNKLKKTVKKENILNPIKVVISITLLLIIILKNINNIEKIKSVIYDTNHFYLIIAFTVFILTLFIETIRWDILLRAHKIYINFGYLFGTRLVGYFYNNVLPSNIGGDVYRVFDISKNKKAPLYKSASTIFMENLFGLITIIIFFSSTSFFLYKIFKNYISLITFFLIIAVMLFLMISNPMLFKIDKLFKKLSKFKKAQEIWLKIQSFSNAVTSYKNKLRYVSLSFFINILCHFLYSVMFYIISLSINLNLSFFYFVFMVPVIFVLTGIPISIGGLGVRENAIVFMLLSFGVINEKAVVFSIIVLLIHLLAALISGVFYFIRSLFFKTKTIF